MHLYINTVFNFHMCAATCYFMTSSHSKITRIDAHMKIEYSCRDVPYHRMAEFHYFETEILKQCNALYFKNDDI